VYKRVVHIIREQFNTDERSFNGVYLVLYEAIRKAIEIGHIPESTQMPPSRLLAEEMGLSRSTVIKAYNLLTENKLVFARQGSGYVVMASPRQNPGRSEPRSGYPRISDIGQSFLQNIHLLGNTETEGMAFTPGLPPLDVFPIGQWQKLTNMYWRHIKSSDLNYSISSGIYPLKKNIANYLLLSRRIHCDPDQIIIVSGSLQSLYLIGNILINKGDDVLVENPTFPNVISIFKSLQAKVNPVEVENDGIDLHKLNRLRPENPKLVHVTPSNQYPLGGKMPLEKRLHLLDWANHNEAIIIENDYEHEINNWEFPVDSIYSLDQQQRTIYLGTFNRILHPSIRLGYMVAPPYLLSSLKALQMHSHRFVPQSIQAVMTDFMSQSLIYKHIRNAINEASDRKALFLSMFEKLFDKNLIIRSQQTSSFHVVAELMEGNQDKQLVSALKTKGIITHPLSKCYLDEPLKQGLILGYSCINRGLLAQYLPKMAGVYFGR
jgi:GntR family transcriptional regulator / MocR family aminotransferase